MKEYTNRLAAVLADLKASNVDDHQLPLFPDHTEAEVTPKAEPKKLNRGKLPSKRSRARVPLNLRTVEGSLLILRNLGFNYIVESQDGATSYKHGLVTSIKAVTPAKKKKANYADKPRGYLRDYVRPQMKDLKVNELLEISSAHPDGTKINLYSLQSAVCNAGNRFWGAGSVTTSMNPKTKNVEVLRLY